MARRGNPKGVKKLGERAVFKTRRFTVFDATLDIRGKRVTKPYIRQKNCVELLPVTKEGKIILIRSYRPELDSYAYEIPSGTLNSGESPLEGARRELEEETGYIAKRMTYMFSGHPLLGYSDCKLHFYLATGLEKKRQHVEEDESIFVEEFTPAEVFSLLKHGKVKDLCAITAMHHYYFAMDRGKNKVSYLEPR